MCVFLLKPEIKPVRIRNNRVRLSCDTSIECIQDGHQWWTTLIFNFEFLYIKLAQVATPTRIRNSWSPPCKLRATPKIPSVYMVKSQPVSANEKSQLPYSLYLNAWIIIIEIIMSIDLSTLSSVLASPLPPLCLGRYSLSMLSFGCNAFRIVISFLGLWSICWSSSLAHFKNGPEYLTRGTAQVFISLMRFLLYSLILSGFLVLLRYSFLIFSFVIIIIIDTVQLLCHVL